MEMILNNWEAIASIILAIGWLVVRLMPTSKNRDLLEKLLTFLSKIVPNNSKELDDKKGFKSHIEAKIEKKILERFKRQK